MTNSLVLLCTFLMAEPPAGSEPEAPTDHAQPPESLAGVSPVELIPRIELRHRFVEPAAGGAVHTSTLRLDIHILRRTLLRYDLPFVTVGAAGMQRSGIGDIGVQSIVLFLNGPRHAAVVIGGLVFDTASAPQLGDGKQQLVFGGAGAFRPWPWWLTFALLQQRLSYEGEPTRPDVNLLFLRAGNVLFSPDGDWYQLDLDTIIDFQGEEAHLDGSLEAGRLLIGRLGVFVRMGTPLLGKRPADYFLDAGVRYLFRLEKKGAIREPK